MRKRQRSGSFSKKKPTYKRQKRFYNDPSNINRSITAPELKAADLGLTYRAFSNNVNSLVLNVIPLGNAASQRVGRKVTNKSLEIRGMIVPTGTNAGGLAQDMGRIIVAYDKQTNGATSPNINIIQDESNSILSTTAWSFANLNARDRYIILMDESIILPAVAALGQTIAGDFGSNIDLNCNQSKGAGQFLFHRFLKLRGCETMYSANTDTITDIQTGGLMIWTVCSNTLAASGWQIIFDTRLRFFDA